MTYVCYTSNKPRRHTSQKTRSSRKNTASNKLFVESSSSRSCRISIYSSAEKDEGLQQPGYLLVSPFIVSDLRGRARCILLYDYLFFYDYTSFYCFVLFFSFKTVSYEEILGLEGSQFSWGKKKGKVSYEEILRKNFLAQNFLRKKSSNFPSRGNFQAQSLLEARGNFTRKL